MRALDWCDANLTTAEDREFVTSWIRDHPDRFQVISVTAPWDLSHLGWTVDTLQDFLEVERIFQALYRPGEAFGLGEILSFLGIDPEKCRRRPDRAATRR